MTPVAIYEVHGMTCGGCVNTLSRALAQALPHVKIEVVLEDGTVRIDGAHRPDAVGQAVQDAGFDFVGPAPSTSS